MTPYRDEDIDQLASSYGKEASPDVEAALAAVKQRIQAADGAAAVRRLPNRKRWLGIAAAALLLITAGYFGLLHNPKTLLANSGDAPLELRLPDGTEVVLQQGATITYAADFNEEVRRIALDGQAFFAVHKDKTRPFLVGNGETELRVTGTAFNLRVEGGELEVEVSEGAVELRKEEQVVAVKANECGLSKPGEPTIKMPAPHLNRHAWRTGKLYFKDAKLSVVVEVLRTNFGIETEVEGNCNYAVTGTYATENPAAILRSVALLGGGSVIAVDNSATDFRLTGVCD